MKNLGPKAVKGKARVAAVHILAAFGAGALLFFSEIQV